MPPPPPAIKEMKYMSTCIVLVYVLFFTSHHHICWATHQKLPFYSIHFLIKLHFGAIEMLSSEHFQPSLKCCLCALKTLTGLKNMYYRTKDKD